MKRMNHDLARNMQSTCWARTSQRRRFIDFSIKKASSNKTRMATTICCEYSHIKETNIMQLRTFRNRYVGKDGRHFEIVYPATATHERVEIHERTESIEYDRFKRRYILTTRDSDGQKHERMFTKQELEDMYSERLLRYLPDGTQYIVSVYW